MYENVPQFKRCGRKIDLKRKRDVECDYRGAAV